MGFYSFYKILKDMVRTIFGKHILKILLFCIFIFLAYICFSSSNVLAVTNIVVKDDYFTENDIAIAQQKVGDSIWNNSDYDIYLSYSAGQAQNNNSEQKGKVVNVYDNTLWSSVNHFQLGSSTNLGNYVGHTFYYNRCYFADNNNNIINSQNNTYKWYNLNTNDSGSGSPVTSNNLGSFQGYPQNTIFVKFIRLSKDIYDANNNLVVTKTTSTAPYFVTTDTQLQEFDFDYLQINGGTTMYSDNSIGDYISYANIRLNYVYQGVVTNIDINQYISVDNNNHWTINIPYNALTNSVVVRNGQEFYYVLHYSPPSTSSGGSSYDINTGTLTYNITTEKENAINEDSLKQVQGAIVSSQQEINSSINNSNVDDITSDSLPSDNTQDITAEGVNGIFTSIYNAFCTGTPQDIVFPIPFTNKNITLSPNYVSNMLNTSNASFIITLIQAFWWYLISRFIIKDVMNKINKIKSGNIEDIETTNIRGDML